MSFEARDVVAVIYSFHYQGYTTLLDPNRHHTHTQKKLWRFELYQIG